MTPGITGIAPFTVYFDASQSSVADGGEGCGSCSIVSYDWNFGDGTTGTGLSTSHEYTTAGTYVVVLTVTDSNDNTGYDSVTITVNAAGVPNTITLQANPGTVSAGGGTSLITATVKDAGGNPVTDGTIVTFTTTTGSLSSYSETTVSGIATTTLTLANAGTETISSTVGATSGTASANVVVYCLPHLLLLRKYRINIIKIKGGQTIFYIKNAKVVYPPFLFARCFHDIVGVQ